MPDVLNESPRARLARFAAGEEWEGSIWPLIDPDGYTAAELHRGYDHRALRADVAAVLGEGDSPWRGPYSSAAEALDAIRRVVAEQIGADPETWPDHGNAPLAIASAFVLAQMRATRPAPADAGEVG